VNQRKLIAIDLDGTLFYPKKRLSLVSRQNIQFLKWAAEQGHHLVFVTSRNRDFVQKVVEKIGLPIDIVSRNGSEVYYRNEIIQKTYLEPSLIKDVFDDITSKYERVMCSIDADSASNLVYSQGKIWYLNLIYRLYYWYQGVYREPYLIDNDVFRKKLASKKDDLQRLLIYFGLSKKAKKISHEESERLKIKFPQLSILWIHSLIEVSPASVNKANGLKEILKREKIEEDNVFVVGDSGNDIPLFEQFKHSFCMTHAHPRIKKHAKHLVRRVYNLKKFIQAS
jgi:Cof subfamily protein (haloacid dehalogenase superfamily)